MSGQAVREGGGSRATCSPLPPPAGRESCWEGSAAWDYADSSVNAGWGSSPLCRRNSKGNRLSPQLHGRVCPRLMNQRPETPRGQVTHTASHPASHGAEPQTQAAWPRSVHAPHVVERINYRNQERLDTYNNPRTKTEGASSQYAQALS